MLSCYCIFKSYSAGDPRTERFKKYNVESILILSLKGGGGSEKSEKRGGSMVQVQVVLKRGGTGIFHT